MVAYLPESLYQQLTLPPASRPDTLAPGPAPYNSACSRPDLSPAVCIRLKKMKTPHGAKAHMRKPVHRERLTI